MKLHIKIFLLFILFYNLISFKYSDLFLADSSKVSIYFFGSPTCGECLEIKEKILFPTQKKYQNKIDLKIYNIDTDSGFNLMTKLEEIFNVKTTASIELFLPDTYLIGSDDIKKYASNMISQRISNPIIWQNTANKLSLLKVESSSYEDKIKDKFKQFSLISIIAAGIVDGINPCAIATLIFLVSFLATKKRSRKEIITIGSCFTFAVFFTYLLLGIGAFKAITSLEHYRWLSLGIKWIAISLAFIIGVYSLIDAYKFSKTKKTENVKIQLPKAIKLQIHKIITANLSGSQLAFGAIVTGFLVTLLEAVCTGQVYLPTIVLMTKQESTRFLGWLYLIFYNILFVLPLILVIILAYFGLKWDKLAKFTQKHLSLLKILLGIVLISLAFFLLLA